MANWTKIQLLQNMQQLLWWLLRESEKGKSTHSEHCKQPEELLMLMSALSDKETTKNYTYSPFKEGELSCINSPFTHLNQLGIKVSL